MTKLAFNILNILSCSSCIIVFGWCGALDDLSAISYIILVLFSYLVITNLTDTSFPEVDEIKSDIRYRLDNYLRYRKLLSRIYFARKTDNKKELERVFREVDALNESVKGDGCNGS